MRAIANLAVTPEYRVRRAGARTLDEAGAD